jgi:hypothetical protein
MVLSPNFAELDEKCPKQVLPVFFAKFEVNYRSARRGKWWVGDHKK